MLAKPCRSIVVELVSGKELNVKLVSVICKEILSWIQLRHRCTAANKSNMSNNVVLDNLRDNILRLV